MLFNSYEFIFIFLPIVWFGYWVLRRGPLYKAGGLWLLCASVWFYAYWEPTNLPVLLVSIFANMAFAVTMRHGGGSKIILATGVLFNLGLLGFFKYTNFLSENLNHAVGVSISNVNVVLPLAISFFTFQQIAYLVDVYRKQAARPQLVGYPLFVSFFPQLIAGPIVHHREMMPQLESLNQSKDAQLFALGLTLFVLGLAKKVLLADPLSLYVTPVFDDGQGYGFQVLLADFAYALQLYFDFSGYSDMALGLAAMFGVHLPQNFNSPYKSKSIDDFWRRWHITLSRFLRDYLYIPMGGNRHGKVREIGAILVTFILGGLWHGAAWAFVIWGLIHGTALLIRRLWTLLPWRLPSVFAWLLTLWTVFLSWIPFRAADLGEALDIGRRLIEWKWSLSLQPTLHVAVLLVLVLIAPNSMQLVSWPIGIKAPSLFRTIAIAVLLVICVLNLGKISPFLYFSF